MFENESALNEFMVNYLQGLAADIAEEEMDEQPCKDFNPPRWTFGHLAVYTDYALRSLGGRFHCPKDWHRHFARGSDAGSVPAVVPTKQEMLDRIVVGFVEVRDRCAKAEPEAMAKPHSVPFLVQTPLKSNAHVVSHLMTTHLAAHAGQLSAWRRMNGRVRVEPAGPVSA